MTRPRTTRQVLEQALADDPDDRAAHAAYADLLAEQGDPRGEFISVQLALEDPARPAEERQHLRQREAELLQAHERDWLDGLAPFLFEEKITDWRRQNNKVNRWRWARGWVEELYLWQLDLPSARALVRYPATRLLRRLHVEMSGYEDEYEAEPTDGIPEDSEYPNLYPLRHAAFLPCLRSFQLGATVDFERETYNSRGTSGEGVAGLVAHMDRLEELYLLARDLALETLFALPNLTRLRVLQVYHEVDVYPLAKLAANPALQNLTTLRLHPAHNNRDDSWLPRAEVAALLRSPNLPSLTHLHLHASDLGDEGCRDIVASGILKRLQVLDLRHGCIHDEGARTLAACPDVKRLELLSLANNELTDAGQELLRGLAIPVRCDHQQEEGSYYYLYSGDLE
jgi:uncharacterized protein (TIGR02996 family)